MVYGYDYVFLLQCCVDVAVCLSGLFQRVASVHYWSGLSCLNRLPQNDEIFSLVRRVPSYYFSFRSSLILEGVVGSGIELTFNPQV